MTARLAMESEVQYRPTPGRRVAPALEVAHACRPAVDGTTHTRARFVLLPFTAGIAMTTTTIRLTPELKARLARAADQAGTTPHRLILAAVEACVSQAEARDEFLRQGRERLTEMEATGMGVPWDEARQYLLERAAGRAATRPATRSLHAPATTKAAPAQPSGKPRARPA